MKECTVAQPQTIYQLEKTGIWGEAVRQARPIMVNDFAAPNPLKKGLPEGHSKLHKYLTIPVFSEGRIVAVVAVANKSDDYNDSDIRQLNLMMDAVWKVVQRKKIEEELKESEARLRELNFTKDKFFSIIAHDLKNPFNCIIGYSDLMVEQIQEKNYEEIDEYAQIIQKSSLQAMDLLANLLEWSRLQTGKIKFNPESIEIAALINEVTELLIPVSYTHLTLPTICSVQISVVAVSLKKKKKIQKIRYKTEKEQKTQIDSNYYTSVSKSKRQRRRHI
eukprot:TRINITY_DN8584_c0_g1_i2.p1 TRINITY_DN8584_c0_g1~~TRINITY_DN8584_c0_g1_i2.p1  ORF type:complete len:277 (+),score=38.08 TRINITY_DN8584_c0_g1_i2:302-1132(+)